MANEYAVVEKKTGVVLNNNWTDKRNAQLMFDHMEKEFPGEYKIIKHSDIDMEYGG